MERTFYDEVLVTDQALDLRPGLERISRTIAPFFPTRIPFWDSGLDEQERPHDLVADLFHHHGDSVRHLVADQRASSSRITSATPLSTGPSSSGPSGSRCTRSSRSAVTKDGIGALRDDLVHLLPEGPLYFPIDQSTDETTENRVAEVIREKALHLTRDEVPHAVTVVVEEIGDKVVRAFLLVETESQKGILVGKKGAMVREIGSRARPEVERLVGHPVFLELVVKVRSKWRRDPKMIERLGM